LLVCIVKVNPFAKNNSVVDCGLDLFGGNLLSVNLSTKPENGKANQELIKVLSEYFSIPMRNITIVSGKTSRTKVVKVVKT
jgi:uncharacterized protein (TIGR00251 family)